MNTHFLEIIQYASKAPSGHNTQPWKFRIEKNSISVFPDANATLPVVDPGNRELLISLGCAVENLCIAAGHFHYEAHLTGYNKAGIHIRLTANTAVTENNLFRQIEKRQTNRSIYNAQKIPGHILEKLTSVHRENNTQFYLAETDSPFARTLTRYITKGNELQMNNKAFKNELLNWMRFNAKQVEKTGDGLSYKVFGNPPLPKAIARLIVGHFLKPGLQNKTDLRKIISSSHLVLFTTVHNTPEEWINSGRTLQRFLLQATEDGIACAFMNQPCEINSLATELRNLLPVNNTYPTLILRIGYARPVPFSPRKNIQKLLV